MQIKDINDLRIRAYQDRHVTKSGKYKYNEKLQIGVIEFHYRTNTPLSTIANILKVSDTTVWNWKLKYGNGITEYKYGNGYRNDLRTRCLAVNEVINGTAIEQLAEKYHVQPLTIERWVKRYIKTYQFYIDHLPDGVPFLYNEDRIHVRTE